ncbi:MAG: DNA topoisomerase IV [Desulfobulbaceae bacterium DB1]|nr:MAG: DNA topoisomerase IV [Desulfobulbaceae bacterium DB1]
MENLTDYGSLHKLFDDNFLDYTSYVIKERAIPDVTDGLKPVQRRIMQTLFNMDDGRFSKVANVVGETMKLHPHGDQSIFGALVNLANKGYLIDRQGNFGNIYTGDGPSAARYIECRLTPLARETLFNKDLTEFVDSYDGRNKEPVVLPSKLPLLLLQGADGIAVGMATKILPHNFCELLEAQKKILKGEPFQLFPDFPQGGRIDVSGYDDGNGRIRCRARIEEKNDKTIIIKEIPYTTTTQSLMDSIEKASKTGKIKIISINDYSAEEVEVEIKLARGLYAQDTIRALYAFSDCEVSISPNLTAIADNRPVNISVSELLRINTENLKNDLERELRIDLDRLREKLHAHLLEQIFIEERLYKQIEECESYKLVVETVDHSLAPFRERLVRDVTREDIERLLEIRIRRISRYDIDKKRRDIKETESAIRQVEKNLKDVVAYTLRYLDKLLDTYGHLYPRRTEISTFTEVEARKVALCNLTVGYHRESGFLGHGVKTDCDRSFACSEYDKILLIFQDGTYKVINVADKVFVGSELSWCGVVDEKLVFNVIYRDADEDMSYIKRFKCPKFILEKEYHLFGGNKKSTMQFLSLGDGGKVRIHYKPSKRAKKNYEDFDFEQFLTKNAAAKGKRVSTRPVRKINELVDRKNEEEEKVEEQEPKVRPLF